MTSEVYLARLQEEEKASVQAEALGRAVQATGFMSGLRRKDMVAVKVHVGEDMNTTHIRPELAARVVSMVHKAKAEWPASNRTCASATGGTWRCAAAGRCSSTTLPSQRCCRRAWPSTRPGRSSTSEKRRCSSTLWWR